MAFSLVEVLVTLSLIVLLVTLCLPVFKSALTQVNLGRSSNALRQIQSVNLLYCAEHDGYYVPIASRNSSGVLERWMDNQEFLNYFGLGLKQNKPWPATLVSPATVLRDSNGNQRIDRSYGMNYTGLTGLEVAGAKWQFKAVNVKYPSQTIALADATDWIIDSYQASAYKTPETYFLHAVAYRYRGKAAVVFYDGHVEARTMEQMTNSSSMWRFD